MGYSGLSVQFFGIDNVVNAYENSNVAPFAIFTGRTLIYKYDGWTNGDWHKPTIEEGVQLLNEFLNSMYEGSTSVYTLKVYEDLEEQEKIKPKTDYSSAFQFKIVNPVKETIGNYPSYGSLKGITDRLDRIESSLSQEETGEPEQPKKSLVHMITGGMIQDNQELKELITIGKMLFEKKEVQPVLNKAMGNVKTQKVGDISSEDTPASDRVKRMEKAISIIEETDPEFLKHLEILSRIAQNDPQQFKQFLLILETL